MRRFKTKYAIKEGLEVKMLKRKEKNILKAKVFIWQFISAVLALIIILSEVL